jgi:hypothetical protein
MSAITRSNRAKVVVSIVAAGNDLVRATTIRQVSLNRHPVDDGDGMHRASSEESRRPNDQNRSVATGTR